MAKFESTHREYEIDTPFDCECDPISKESGIAPTPPAKLRPGSRTGCSRRRPLLKSRLFQPAFENADDAMMIVDGKCNVVAFNYACEKLTGWPRSQAVGRYCWEIYSCRDPRHTIQCGCPRMSVSGKKVVDSCIEHKFAGNGGREITVYMTHSTFCLHSNTECYQLIIVRLNSTPSASRILDQDALASMSHEVLSPINLIRGYAATLSHLDGALSPEQKHRYLQAIESATFRASQSIRNLLSFPSLEATSLQLVKQPISLTGLVRRVVTEIQTQSPNHVIEVHASRALPMANIDCKKIEQVLINLLLNAVKYSTQGSNVEVTIWQAQNNEELISILRNSPHISLPCMIVCVRDSGVGIPENELELVFEKYYRVDNKLNRTVHGMGMGLYICKVIVEAHGGHIWAKSNDGRGSTFAFSVPLQESASVVRQLQLDLHCEPHSPASRLETFSVNKVKAPM